MLSQASGVFRMYDRGNSGAMKLSELYSAVQSIFTINSLGTPSYQKTLQALQKMAPGAKEFLKLEDFQSILRVLMLE